MKIYTLKANVNNYPVLAPVDWGVERYRHFDGHPLAPPPDALRVEVVKEGQTLPAGDFPGLTSHIPVFSRRSAAALDEILDAAGQMIPLRCESCADEYVAVNVTRLVDALDERRSEVKRYRSSGRIMRILHYAFLRERVAGMEVFKIPQTVLQEVYVSEAFVERVAGRSLQGFVFKLIWTDEAAVILCPYCLGVIEEQTAHCPTCGMDTRRDAPLEMSLAEARGMKRVPCSFCRTRIHEWADPCPYCKRGRQRQGVQEDIVKVV
jgi:hypothetical protein